VWDERCCTVARLISAVFDTRGVASVNDCGVTRVRFVSDRPRADSAWNEVVDAARGWRSHGAPFAAIAEMVADDYGIALDEDTLRQVVNGWSDEKQLRDLFHRPRCLRRATESP
jgi:hypothetical protein